MKKSILLFFLIVWFINVQGQKDSLQLKLSYEVSRDLQNNIRVDFISNKIQPILFQEFPVYLVECGYDDMKLETEFLDGNCFRKIVQSDCTPISNLQTKFNLKQINKGDTSIYRDYIRLLDGDKINKEGKNIKASYRIRFSRIFLVNGKKQQIFSNWLFANYE